MSGRGLTPEQIGTRFLNDLMTGALGGSIGAKFSLLTNSSRAVSARLGIQS